MRGSRNLNIAESNVLPTGQTSDKIEYYSFVGIKNEQQGTMTFPENSVFVDQMGPSAENVWIDLRAIADDAVAIEEP
jgi:hypothetical protein